jgi:uncharacterized phage protein (TIGR01671 family)
MNIKFRAWDERNNKWITDGDIYMSHDGQFFAGDFDNPPVVAIHESKITFSTGLKDKYGQEIYEGDILGARVDSRDILKCEVLFNSPSFCRKWLNQNTVKLRGTETEVLPWNTHIIYEVLGNIYENPNLLEIKP